MCRGFAELVITVVVRSQHGREAVSDRYHGRMAMTLRLTDDERAALQRRAEREGISMQEAARRAVREFIDHGDHQDRVSAAAARILEAHADALRRLGE